LGTVLVLSSGGVEHNGGIGRQMGYFLRARNECDNGVTYRVIDTRGPWFLGASRKYTVLAVGYLAGAIMQLVWARLSTASCLVHVNIAGRGSTLRKIILSAVARTVGLRYLVHVHDYDYAQEYERHGRFMRARIATVFRGAMKVVVLGSRDQRNLTRLLDLPADRITVLHNAVPDPGPAVARARTADAPCHLLFLGDLSERKGVPELLRALASPPLASRAWRATLAGGGKLDAYRALATSLGVAERVNFAGWLNEAGVKALAADADVLVLPSHAEGLAMAVLEGLAHGLTVITTPVGAHPEVIVQDVCGLFVPPGDVDALADALVRVIDDAALCERLGRGARRRFLDMFDVRGYAERLGRLHADLLTSAARPAAQPLGEEQTSP